MKNKFKGTQGEWVADSITDDGIVLRDKNNTRDIATIWGYEDCFLENKEMMSNVKLIACAPEMLEALIHIEDYVRRSLTLSGHSEKDIEIILRRVSPVIKKATDHEI